jgi:hypothetical protein
VPREFFEENAAAVKPAAMNDDQTRSPAAKRRRRRNDEMRVKVIMVPHIRARGDLVNGISDTATT